MKYLSWCTYVATGEVTSLKHELWDDTVEGRASISEALLASAESTEVLSSLWYNVVIEDEVDATGLLYRERQLCFPRGRFEKFAIR
jgi:hypothetical protein